MLAVLMLLSSSGSALINKWLGAMSWIAVALTVASTLTWSLGLLRRSAVIAAFVKIGFGFSGLAAPVVAVAGLAIAQRALTITHPGDATGRRAHP